MALAAFLLDSTSLAFERIQRGAIVCGAKPMKGSEEMSQQSGASKGVRGTFSEGRRVVQWVDTPGTHPQLCLPPSISQKDRPGAPAASLP